MYWWSLTLTFTDWHILLHHGNFIHRIKFHKWFKKVWSVCEWIWINPSGVEFFFTVDGKWGNVLYFSHTVLAEWMEGNNDQPIFDTFDNFFRDKGIVPLPQQSNHISKLFWYSNVFCMNIFHDTPLRSVRMLLIVTQWLWHFED